MASAYRRERVRDAIHSLGWALKSGRKPKAVYGDNGSCFISKEFDAFARSLESPLIVPVRPTTYEPIR